MQFILVTQQLEHVWLISVDAVAQMMQVVMMEMDAQSINVTQVSTNVFTLQETVTLNCQVEHAHLQILLQDILLQTQQDICIILESMQLLMLELIRVDFLQQFNQDHVTTWHVSTDNHQLTLVNH